MQIYELTFLFKQEEEVKKAQRQIEDWIKKLKGKVLKKDNWGVRDLVYKIKKHPKALYLFYKAELPLSAPAELNKKVNLTENVIRHLIIKFESRKRQ